MKKLMIGLAAVAVFVAACSSSGGDAVASLDDAASVGAIADDAATDATNEGTDEESILAFAACMRENGIEEFEDPNFNADGSLEFGFRGQAQNGDIDQDTIRAAFQACQSHLEGLAFGPGSIDRSEIEDNLVEFAACMRKNGYDIPDPDFSSFGQGQGQGGGGGGPFGGDIDPNDPSFQSALEACEDIFGGVRFGGAGARGGNG